MKTMKLTILAAAAFILASAFVSTPVSAQGVTPGAFQYEEAIQVSGRAERKITPDDIRVAITLRDGQPKGQTVATLEERMRREFTALGIDLEKSLRVNSMANAPRRRNQVDTSRSYELRVSDAATLGGVFEALGEMGVPEAHVTGMTHTRIEEFRREVRVEAVKNARDTAAQLAEALGQSVGHAVWIQDGGFYENAPAPLFKMRGMLAGVEGISARGVSEEAAPALEMQEITLTYTVSAKFVLGK